MFIFNFCSDQISLQPIIQVCWGWLPWCVHPTDTLHRLDCCKHYLSFLFNWSCYPILSTPLKFLSNFTNSPQILHLSCFHASSGLRTCDVMKLMYYINIKCPSWLLLLCTIVYYFCVVGCSSNCWLLMLLMLIYLQNKNKKQLFSFLYFSVTMSFFGSSHIRYSQSIVMV